MGLKPLGIVKEIVESAGMGISYAYDDLVFIDHNAFLLQFTDIENRILVHINREAQKTELNESTGRLKKEALARGIFLQDGGYYVISKEGDENIRLEFIKPE